jgi:hypothetical protein
MAAGDAAAVRKRLEAKRDRIERNIDLVQRHTSCNRNSRPTIRAAR